MMSSTYARLFSSCLCVFVVIVLLLQSIVLAADPAENKEVWMGPPAMDGGRCLRELFEHPDEWRETRELVDVLQYADHMIQKQFSDDELREWLPKLKQWNLKLALEVGAIKEWGTTGQKTFDIERRTWDRIERLGGTIYAIAMDEPLFCAREKLQKSNEYAVEETATFIELVRKNFPNMLVGDIETYPSIGLDDHRAWIDALQRRLAEKQVRGLDFYRLDVNWTNFNAQSHGSWKEVRTLEQFCRSRKLPFSLIYWSSIYPPMQRRGLADDRTWYVSIFEQAYDYALVDGRPDQFVIESWIEAPSRCIPESGDFTFTRSVRDFARTFAKKK